MTSGLAEDLAASTAAESEGVGSLDVVGVLGVTEKLFKDTLVTRKYFFGGECEFFYNRRYLYNIIIEDISIEDIFYNIIGQSSV